MKADKKLKYRVQKGKLQDKIETVYPVSEVKTYRSKNTKRLKKALRNFLVLLLCALMVFLLFNVNYLTPYRLREHMRAVSADMGKGDGYPFQFSSNTVSDCFYFGSNDIAVLHNTELLLLNKSAKLVCSYKHNMTNPIAKYSKDRILLYDQGASKAVILNQSGVVIQFPFEEKIICGDIADNGRCVFALRDSSNKEIVSVHDVKGKRMMKWEKGSGYIIDTAINASGALIAVGIVDTVDAMQTNTILSFNTSNAVQKGHLEVKDCSLYNITYLKNSDLAVLCSSKLLVLNAKCAVRYENELPSLSNAQLFTDADNHIINVYSQYNSGNYMIDVYNASLKKIYAKECEREIKSVYSSGKTLATLYHDSKAELNLIGGKVTYGIDLQKEYTFILSKGTVAYLCSCDGVEKVKAVKQ